MAITYISILEFSIIVVGAILWFVRDDYLRGIIKGHVSGQKYINLGYEELKLLHNNRKVMNIKVAEILRDAADTLTEKV